MPRVTFQCNDSFVSHVSEIFFSNLKFWPSFKPMIIYRSAKGEVLKKRNFVVLCVAMRPKRSEMVVLPPFYRPTNF